MSEQGYYPDMTEEFQSKDKSSVGFGELTAAQKTTIESASPEVRAYVDQSRPFGHGSADLAIRNAFGEQPQMRKLDLDL